MDLSSFEQRAFEMWESIPARFREGVSAFIVEPGTWTNGNFEDDWCYGTCEPDAAMAAVPGAEVCSIIRIWYGSFVKIERDTEDFDWEEELWETIRHELQHHVEWRAGLGQRDLEDDLEIENERRWRGEPFAPWFHRQGVPMGQGAWLAADDLFIEVRLKRKAWLELASTGCSARWGSLRATVDPVPAGELARADLLYYDAAVEMLGSEDEPMIWGGVVLVLVRVRGWFGW